MKITEEITSLRNAKLWQGGNLTRQLIIWYGLEDEFWELLEECYEELTETELNDILWFDEEFIYDFIREWTGVQDIWETFAHNSKEYCCYPQYCQENTPFKPIYIQ